jgi:hypothetical protein
MASPVHNYSEEEKKDPAVYEHGYGSDIEGESLAALIAEGERP